MPLLRFARDPRGYESTYLVEATRKGSQSANSLLYWFRTPPHVKVGRAAFDEDAIRLLEQQHPDIDFDWDRILTAKPAAAPEPREGRGGRSERRGPREGRREDGRRRDSAPVERRERVVAPATREVTPVVEPAAPVVPVVAIAEPHTPDPVPTAVESLPEPSAPVRRFVRVFDLPPEAAAENHASDLSAAERRLGPEQLTMLRARYAEILACITARGGEPARIDALRERAERANPDAWVTDAEVVTGLAEVDGVLAELHQQVGRRRRRRRRGGRGRRAEAPGTSAALAQTESDAAGPPTDEAHLDGEEDGPPS